MSENYGLKVSCGRHGIVGCERCFGSYRLVRPMVRRTELDELRAERDSLAASLEAKDAELSELRARVEKAVRLHTRMERGDGCRYCDYNDDMGGNGWPCPTVAILAPEGERE